MYKKKKLLISLILIPVILIIVSVLVLASKGIIITKYSKIIYSNWKINLPNKYEEIYSYQDKSFLGDGNKYHIFKYEDKINLSSYINFIDGKNIILENEIKKGIKIANISEKYLPNFNEEYKYYIKEKDDSSKIYMVYILNLNELYIFESLY
ncbi:MAG: hypothetical protein ACLRXI_08300 [Clostridia bacterium]|jgi:hypothetical protein